MIDIINKIFVEAGLEEKPYADFKIYILKEQKNFWVIAHYAGDEIKNVLNEQIELFVKTKEIVQDPTFDKNVNLLVLNKVSKLDDVKLDDLLQIEENPYHFKKSVMYYTEVELKNLTSAIDESNVLTSIESLILKEEIFEQHKTSFDANSFESLVYRMAIKIPFLKIRINQTNNLKSLEEINKKSVGNNPLDEILEQDFFTLSDEDFSKMTNETILEKLKAIIPNEDQQN